MASLFGQFFSSIYIYSHLQPLGCPDLTKFENNNIFSETTQSDGKIIFGRNEVIGDYHTKSYETQKVIVDAVS